MNYLAHLYLAGDQPGIIVGALLEDYIVGGVESESNRHLPEPLKAGLKLHRFIDTYTDTHEKVSLCKHYFYGLVGKYASVALDVVFDHFLHKNWEILADEEFDVFKKRVYFVLQNYYMEHQPEKMQALVRSMVEYDWLKDYLYQEGIAKALRTLNRRVAGADLTAVLPVVDHHYEEINALFLPFFRELKHAVGAELLNYGY